MLHFHHMTHGDLYGNYMIFFVEPFLARSHMKKTAIHTVGI